MLSGNEQMEDFAEILKTIVPVLAPGWPGLELEVSPGDLYAELDDFATFAASASNRAAERYLDQIRIVSSTALRGLFGISAEDPLPRPARPVSIRQLVHRFVELERQRWGSGYSAALAGTLGGDGDWAKESLAFGLMVENTYWGVYRVWSRPWLVTK